MGMNSRQVKVTGSDGIRVRYPMPTLCVTASRLPTSHRRARTHSVHSCGFVAFFETDKSVRRTAHAQGWRSSVLHEPRLSGSHGVAYHLSGSTLAALCCGGFVFLLGRSERRRCATVRGRQPPPIVVILRLIRVSLDRVRQQLFKTAA